MAAPEQLPPDVAVGIDLGGTKMLVQALDERGRIIFNEQKATGRTTGPVECADAIEAAVRRIARRAHVTAVGVGFPGLVDARGGTVLSSVILDGWRDVSLGAVVSERLGVLCAVDNDVNNAARAEAALRRSEGRDMLFVTVGSGIGGALILDGKVWRGSRGLAGEIGHVAVDKNGPRCLCGRIGCAGPRASGNAIGERLGAVSAEIQRLADAGDPKAWAVIRETTALLGSAIGSALNLLNLPLVAIGGGVAELGPRYISLVRDAVRAETFAEVFACCSIEKARAGYGAGATGAALMAREQMMERSGASMAAG